MKLSFAWWNVGLKPPVSGMAEPAPSSVLKPWFLYCRLDELIDLDVIAFGEVGGDFFDLLSKPFERAGFSAVSMIEKRGRLIFDTVLFYRSSKLCLLDFYNIVHPHYSGNLKVASRLQFEVIDTGEVFYFYVSHWPSRMSRPELGRDELGSKLRSDIDDLFKIDGYAANIILLGDYNDEPFDKPIYDKLIATRDRKVVLDRPFILYNPFWRSLGGGAPYAGGEKISPCHGTYYYKSSSHVTKWFTFDQIIVSSSFMGHSNWHLDEACTKIFSYADDDDFGAEFFKDFDHLPIYGRVVKNYE
jgi:hypothetical protein